MSEGPRWWWLPSRRRAWEAQQAMQDQARFVRGEATIRRAAEFGRVMPPPQPPTSQPRPRPEPTRRGRGASSYGGAVIDTGAGWPSSYGGPYGSAPSNCDGGSSSSSSSSSSDGGGSSGGGGGGE